MLSIPAIQTAPPSSPVAPVPSASVASLPSVNVLSMPQSKPIIILHTVDLPDEAKNNLRSYGKFVEYSIDVEGNLPIGSLEFDYLSLDIRERADRKYWDANDTSNYQIVAYISLIEKFDQFIDSLGATSIFTDFPTRQHFKADFDRLLLSSVTGSPSKLLSCVTFFNSFFDSLKAVKKNLP